MTADLIDGKAFAATLRARVAERVATLKADHGITPGLAVVIVGENPASQIYVRNKVRQTEEAGMNSIHHELPDTVSEDALLSLIADLNADEGVHGILVQLPLPDHIDDRKVIDAIDPDKDADGFHPVNAGRLATGLKGMVPCTPLGCLLMLKDRHGSLSGMDAVVIGRSNIVGKPMAQLLLADSCTVTIAHSRTKDLPAVVKQADIVVAAVGVPHLVKADWLKETATVIDVGMNRLPPEQPDGKPKLVGDVDFDAAKEVCAAITPVPGGVGPMTIACLLANTVTCAERLGGLAEITDWA